jgi:two-component system NtrC family sensor kinase
VAHEINNPLGSIMTNVQNLLDEEEDEERSVSLKWIEQETRRIARIVRELLDFSSSDLGRTQKSDVNAVIDETISLIGYSLKKTQDVRIRTEFDVEIPRAMISQDELKQIMINLVKNSIQALEGKGEILLSTNYEPEEERVQMSIQDTGKGIREEDIPRIFDPFYTTKPTGMGSGLGLWVSLLIAEAMGGTITARSSEGEGTRMTLVLPVAEEDEGERLKREG